MAFTKSGLCASSIYILNDLPGLQTDHQHPTKGNRPLESGMLPILEPCF